MWFLGTGYGHRKDSLFWFYFPICLGFVYDHILEGSVPCLSLFLFHYDQIYFLVLKKFINKRFVISPLFLCFWVCYHLISAVFFVPFTLLIGSGLAVIINYHYSLYTIGWLSTYLEFSVSDSANNVYYSSSPYPCWLFL
jgi:hypothetical protein